MPALLIGLAVGGLIAAKTRKNPDTSTPATTLGAATPPDPNAGAPPPPPPATATASTSASSATAAAVRTAKRAASANTLLTPPAGAKNVAAVLSPRMLLGS